MRIQVTEELIEIEPLETRRGSPLPRLHDEPAEGIGGHARVGLGIKKTGARDRAPNPKGHLDDSRNGNSVGIADGAFDFEGGARGPRAAEQPEENEEK